jgi:hypothetical protein
VFFSLKEVFDDLRRWWEISKEGSKALKEMSCAVKDFFEAVGEAPENDKEFFPRVNRGKPRAGLWHAHIIDYLW